MELEQIVNPVKRFLGISLLAGALAMNPFFARNTQAQEKSDKTSKIESFFSIDLGIYETPLINKVENIPLKIRNVPKHPADDYVNDKNVAPIESDNIKLAYRMSWLNPKIGCRSSFLDENIMVKLGMGLDFYPAGIFFFDYTTKERNYVHYPGTEKRGTGEALTYYSIHPICLEPNIFSEIETNIAEKIKLGLGYKLSKVNIIAENGWDRYNQLERRKKYNLSGLVYGKPYISLIYGEKDDVQIALFFGLNNLIKKRFTNLGKQMNIDFNNKAWFVGFKIGI